MTDSQDIQDCVNSNGAFVAGITVTNPDGTITNLNPLDCGTLRLANLIAALLLQTGSKGEPAVASATVVQDWPNGVSDVGPFVCSGKVSFIDITDVSGNKTHLNAGREGSVFTHGYPVLFCEGSLRASVKNALAGN